MGRACLHKSRETGEEEIVYIFELALLKVKLVGTTTSKYQRNIGNPKYLRISIRIGGEYKKINN